MSAPDGLKQKVVVAGGTLTIRNLAAAAISIGGNIIIVRYLGLELYGLQGVAAFFASVLTSVSELSIGLYILRFPGEVDQRRLNTSATLLILFSTAAVLIGSLVLAPVLGWWYNDPSLTLLMIACSLALGIAAPMKIPLVLIERRLDYRRVSAIEICGMAAYYIPAIICVLSGLKIWSLVIAEICKSLCMLVLTVLLNPSSFRLQFDRIAAKEILKFGLPASMSGWVWMISGALNPVLIGRVVGLEAAGLVRLAQGIINQFSFFNGIVSRLSLSVLGRIQEEKERALRAVNQSAIFSYFLITLPLCAFACVGSWVIPAIYGTSSSEAAIYLVIAIVPYAINMIFTGQTYLLMAVGKNSELFKLHVIRSIGVWLAAAALVSYLKFYSIAVAEIIVLPVFFILHVNTKALFGAPRYRDPMILFIGAYAAVLLSQILNEPLWGLALLLAANTVAFFLISDTARKQILETLAVFWTTIRFSLRIAGREPQL